MKLKPSIGLGANGSSRVAGALRASLVGFGLLGSLALGSQAKAIETRNPTARVDVVNPAAPGFTQSIFCDINVQFSQQSCTNFQAGNTIFGVLGDKKVSNIQVLNINPALQSGLEVKFNWLSDDDSYTTFADDKWEFIVTAKPTYTGPLNLTYQYDVDVVDGGFYACIVGANCSNLAPNPAQAVWVDNPIGTSDPWFFNDISLEANVTQDPNGTVTVSKVSNPPGIVSQLISLNGGPAGLTYKFSADLKKITITDTIFVPTGRDITSVTNAWTQRTNEVPGPLPILGAGVAFGMSRNLRRRIKARAKV